MEISPTLIPAEDCDKIEDKICYELLVERFLYCIMITKYMSYNETLG